MMLRPGALGRVRTGLALAAMASALVLPSTLGVSPAGAATATPLAVVATTPATAAVGVRPSSVLSVTFSAPVSAHSPMPTIAPAVAGSWQAVTPTVLVFNPTAPLAPSTTYVVTVPAGVTGTTGGSLATPVSSRFTVAPGSTLRLQQLLAELGYLPVRFTPDRPLLSTRSAADPQQGSFSWKFAPPASLAATWTPGVANEATRGAVMAFESTHNLAADGSAGPAVWQALLADASGGTATAAPYNYVYVSKTLPERTTVYSNGTVAFSTLANTGVPGAPTVNGTFPVYLRYTTTTMSGTNPDGSKYKDPGIPWVSYFNGGDALHGFVRSSYGYPQSVGCVEMLPADAGVVYPLTPIGTLVTVAD